MNDLMIKVDNVSKMYKLGQIGGTTLRDELQRLRARRRGEEDPTKRIGAKDYNRGETFMALSGVSFEVKKGERVGIIGHNGAGKSTLLKLLSRITAPTEGEIGLNGRVASMLEVGTGFHGELTGRENIYMNGAILGMTKKEIDEKMEDIIEFSECRQFIDTPVKRYSSGMYVKLAFSVSAHLDSEIMIMDEVLAVGDMAFQKKCLDKMNDVSRSEGRTILYVSHNMNTIRQLCDRCIVLDHGKVVFDGGVEEGIAIYLDSESIDNKFDFQTERTGKDITGKLIIKAVDILDGQYNREFGNKIKLVLLYNVKADIEGLFFRFCIYRRDGAAIATSVSEKIICRNGENTAFITIDTSCLSPDKYVLKIIAIELSEMGTQVRHDCINRVLTFSIYSGENQLHNFIWDTKWWGNYVLPDATVDR